MNKELFEKELCQSVELVSMLEHICAASTDETLPVAGMQLTLIQLRSKLLELMAKSQQDTQESKPVYSSNGHGVPLSQKIKKVPMKKTGKIRELLVHSDQQKEVINW